LHSHHEYRLTAPVTIPKGLTIEGHGARLVADHAGNCLEPADRFDIYGGLRIVRAAGDQTGSGIAWQNTGFASNIHLDHVSINGFDKGYDLAQQSAALGIVNIYGGILKDNNYAFYGNGTGQINILDYRGVRCFQNQIAGWYEVIVKGATFAAADAEGQSDPFVFTELSDSVIENQWFEANGTGDYGIHVKGGHGTRIGPQKGGDDFGRALVRLERCTDFDVAGPAQLKNCKSCRTRRQTGKFGRWQYDMTDAADDQYWFGWCDELPAKGDATSKATRILEDKGHGQSFVENDLGKNFNKSVTDNYLGLPSMPVTEINLDTDGGRIGVRRGLSNVGDILVYTIPMRLMAGAANLTASNTSYQIKFFDSGFNVLREVGFSASGDINERVWKRHIGRWGYICFAAVIPASTAKIDVIVRPDTTEPDAVFQFGQPTLKIVPPVADQIAEDIVPDLGAGLIQPRGTTAIRPAAPTIGSYYFDTDLGKPIFYDGTQWTDATGTAV
jgi:hypothetical protein